MELDLRPTPFSADSEAGLLACCIGDPSLVPEARAAVRAEAFGWGPYRTLAESLYALDEKGVRFDILTLPDLLKQRGVYDEVGGWEMLKQLSAVDAVRWNLGEYAKTVREHWQRRTFVETCRADIGAALDHTPIEELLAGHETRIASLAEQTAANDGYTSQELFLSVQEQLESGETLDFLRTGESYIDNALKPIRGYTVVIAGRPQLGKTARALKFALRWAMKGYRGHFYTLEQPKEEIAHRAISSLSGLPLDAITESTLSPDQLFVSSQAAVALADLPITWFDDPGMAVAGIRARAQKAKRKGGLDFIVIDQLNRLETGQRHDSDNQRFSLLMRQLKNMGRAVNVVVVVLAQLNRDLEKRPNKRPQLSDLRDSGNIEAEASIVLACYRESFYEAQKDGEPEPFKTPAELGIIKYQNGKCGILYDVYDRSTQRFFREDDRHEDPKAVKATAPAATATAGADTSIAGTRELSLEIAGDYQGCVSGDPFNEPKPARHYAENY